MFNVLTCLANIEPPPTQIQGKFQCLSPGSVDNTPTILQCLLCHSIQMFDLCSLLSDWTGTITFHPIWFDKTGSPWQITEIIQNRNVMNGYVGKMILFKLNIPSWLFKSVYCLLALKSFFYENCCSHIQVKITLYCIGAVICRSGSHFIIQVTIICRSRSHFIVQVQSYVGQGHTLSYRLQSYVGQGHTLLYRLQSYVGQGHTFIILAADTCMSALHFYHIGSRHMQVKVTLYHIGCSPIQVKVNVTKHSWSSIVMPIGCFCAEIRDKS